MRGTPYWRRPAGVGPGPRNVAAPATIPRDADESRGVLSRRRGRERRAGRVPRRRAGGSCGRRACGTGAVARRGGRRRDRAVGARARRVRRCRARRFATRRSGTRCSGEPWLGELWSGEPWLRELWLRELWLRERWHGRSRRACPWFERRRLEWRGFGPRG